MAFKIFNKKSFQPTICIMLSLLFTGCSSVPSVELETFVAKPELKRIIDKPTVSWLIREDVAEYCKTKFELPTGSNLLACSIWVKEKKLCTIITGPNTSHVILGHEIRHCFEGTFHK